MQGLSLQSVKALSLQMYEINKKKNNKSAKKSHLSSIFSIFFEYLLRSDKTVGVLLYFIVH